MAVEDGATLGRLIGLLNTEPLLSGTPTIFIPQILDLFEALRKSRTTLNVQGATSNRFWFHLADGPLQVERDIALRGGPDSTDWCFLTPDYWMGLDIRFDAVADGERAFGEWLAKQKMLFRCAKDEKREDT
jgi:salicylate hydroxylase